MWSIYEILSTGTMTIWVIMLFVWLGGFILEFEFCHNARARKYVWKKWKTYNIVFISTGALMVLSFIIMVKIN